MYLKICNSSESVSTRMLWNIRLVLFLTNFCYISLKIKPNSVRIRSLNCHLFVLPSTRFELTPLIHSGTNRFVLIIHVYWFISLHTCISITILFRYFPPYLLICLFFLHFLYDSAINICIISYLLTTNEKKGKEREKSFLFCLYDSAINIHVFMLGN